MTILLLLFFGVTYKRKGSSELLEQNLRKYRKCKKKIIDDDVVIKLNFALHHKSTNIGLAKYYTNKLEDRYKEKIRWTSQQTGAWFMYNFRVCVIRWVSKMCRRKKDPDNSATDFLSFYVF